MKENKNIEDLLKVIKNQLEDDKIEPITTFDVRNKSPITSYVIIGTGTSTKHISSSAEKLADKVEEFFGESLNIGMEGKNKTAHWILVDFNEVMVHLFTGEAREQYNLEELLSKR